VTKKIFPKKICATNLMLEGSPQTGGQSSPGQQLELGKATQGEFFREIFHQLWGWTIFQSAGLPASWWDLIT